MNLQTVIDQLNWREAIKSFDPEKKVSDNDFEQLLEVARLTASSYGLQPWKFVVIKNEDTRKQLQAAAYNQSQVGQASHFVVLCAKAKMSEVDVDHYLAMMAETRGIKVEDLAQFKNNLMNLISNKNEVDLQTWSAKQVYIVLGNLLTACAIAGIDACPMEGFDPGKYSEILGLEKLGLIATVACAIGYRSDDGGSADSRKKVRFSRNDVVIEK